MSGGSMIGTIKCLVCSELNPVKEQKNGLAGYHCPWCGLNVYARAKDADQRLRAKMTAKVEPTLEEPPAPKPAAAAVEPPKAKPAPKTRGVFGI